MPKSHAAERTTDTADQVRTLVAEFLAMDEAQVTADAAFVDDLHADSLDCVEIAMLTEEHFGLPEIDEDVAERLQTVGALVAYVTEHRTK